MALISRNPFNNLLAPPPLPCYQITYHWLACNHRTAFALCSQRSIQCTTALIPLPAPNACTPPTCRNILHDVILLAQSDGPCFWCYTERLIPLPSGIAELGDARARFHQCRDVFMQFLRRPVEIFQDEMRHEPRPVESSLERLARGASDRPWARRGLVALERLRVMDEADRERIARWRREQNISHLRRTIEDRQAAPLWQYQRKRLLSRFQLCFGAVINHLVTEGHAHEIPLQHGDPVPVATLYATVGSDPESLAMIEKLERTGPGEISPDDDCGICTFRLIGDGPEGGREARIPRRLPCGHVFHQRCISKWLWERKHRAYFGLGDVPNCPLDRTAVDIVGRGDDHLLFPYKWLMDLPRKYYQVLRWLESPVPG